MLQLPDELIYQIGQHARSYLDDFGFRHKEDDKCLQSLVLTCRRLYAVLRPILFHTITYTYSDALHEVYDRCVQRDSFIQRHLSPNTVEEIVLIGSSRPNSDPRVASMLNDTAAALLDSAVVAPRISLSFRDLPMSAASWLHEVSHRVRHVSLLMDASYNGGRIYHYQLVDNIVEDDDEDPFYPINKYSNFNSAVPFLRELPALMSLSIINVPGCDDTYLAGLFEYINLEGRDKVIHLRSLDYPYLSSPALRSLSIAEGALHDIQSCLPRLKPLEGLRTLEIRDEHYRDRYERETEPFQGSICELVNALCPEVERLVCLLLPHESGNFPPSLRYLHITADAWDFEGIDHLRKSIATGLYPALQYFILEVDWSQMLDYLWNTEWEPKAMADRCTHCKILGEEGTDASSEAGEHEEDEQYDVEYLMLRHFYNDIRSILNKASIGYSITPMASKAAYFSGYSSSIRDRERKVRPKHLPYAKTYKQYKLEINSDGRIVLGGWADVITRCSGLPFEPCFYGSFPK